MDSIIFDVDGTLWDSTESRRTEHGAGIFRKKRIIWIFHLLPLQLKALFGQLLSDIAKQLVSCSLSESEQLRIIDGCCQAEHEALLIDRPDVYDGLEKTLKDLGKRYPLIYCKQLSGWLY